MIIGHERNILFLKKFLQNDIPIHAFLFWGPEKVGKKLVATAFADGILCLEREFGGCGACVVCDERHNIGKARDFLLVKPENDVITIDSAREIVRFLSKTPGISKKKVVVIDDADYLTEEAQNTLLKTAEEPPRDSILIFVASRPGRLLETLRSRLVEMRFQLMQDVVVAALPEIKKLNEKEKTVAIALAAGRIGKAVEFANNSVLAVSEANLFGMAEKMTSAPIPDKILFAKDIVEKSQLKDILTFWMSRFHKKLHDTNDADELRDIAHNAKLAMTASFLMDETNVSERLLAEQLLLSMI